MILQCAWRVDGRSTAADELRDERASRIRPDARLSAVLATGGGGFVRFGIATVVLSLALRQSLLSGILLFVGMLVTRWVAVYLLNTGRLPWNWAHN